MQPANLPLRIPRGVTWRKSLTIMQPEYVYKPITSINATAPLTLTVDHQLPQERWPIWIEGSTSSELNTDKKRQRFRMVRALDASTIELNGINGHSIKASSGYVVYQLPVDFAGCTASMVFSSAGGDIELTDAAGLELGNGLISATLTAEQNLALPDKSSYALWVTHPNGDEIKWLCGEVSVYECENNSAC